MSLLDAPDEDFGQAWHIPCAPAITPREILAIGAKSFGKKTKVTNIPMWLLPIFGLFMPFMKEMVEMRFQWNRPYDVDSSKFAKRFWSDSTPFEIGAVETMKSFS